MFADDDDIEDVSLSVRSDKSQLQRKREALKQKLQKEGMATQANAAAMRDLQGLKGQIEGRKDEQTKRDRAQQEKIWKKTGTLTRKQEEEARVLRADEQPTAQGLVEEGGRDAAAREEEKREEVQQEGG